jgi:hypothetical protein
MAATGRLIVVLSTRLRELAVPNPDEAELRTWHRRFAVECNNRAWELTALTSRTEDQNAEMLHAAYAAAFHWSQVGTPINLARADMLLAHVLSVLGQTGLALSYARRCLDFCEHNDCEDWDRAFAHAEMAHAAAAAGDEELHREHYRTAEKLGQAIEDAEDRKVFATEFARIPREVV